MTEYLTKEFPYQARSFVSCAQIGERQSEKRCPPFLLFPSAITHTPFIFFAQILSKVHPLSMPHYQDSIGTNFFITILRESNSTFH